MMIIITWFLVRWLLYVHFFIDSFKTSLWVNCIQLKDGGGGLVLEILSLEHCRYDFKCGKTKSVEQEDFGQEIIFVKSWWMFHSNPKYATEPLGRRVCLPRASWFCFWTRYIACYPSWSSRHSVVLAGVLWSQDCMEAQTVSFCLFVFCWFHFFS